MNLRLIALVMPLILAGCSNSTYSCREVPTGGCQPMSDVYNRTGSGFYDYRKEMYKGGKGGSGHSHVSSAKDLKINIAKANRTLNYAAPGDPLLSKPVTMRILFNTWLDEEQDLNGGGFVYIKLKDSQWLVD